MQVAILSVLQLCENYEILVCVQSIHAGREMLCSAIGRLEDGSDLYLAILEPSCNTSRHVDPQYKRKCGRTRLDLRGRMKLAKDARHNSLIWSLRSLKANSARLSFALLDLHPAIPMWMVVLLLCNLQSQTSRFELCVHCVGLHTVTGESQPPSERTSSSLSNDRIWRLSGTSVMPKGWRAAFNILGAPKIVIAVLRGVVAANLKIVRTGPPTFDLLCVLHPRDFDLHYVVGQIVKKINIWTVGVQFCIRVLTCQIVPEVLMLMRALMQMVSRWDWNVIWKWPGIIS